MSRPTNKTYENFRLFLGTQINTLGVTATFNIENTSLGPAVLVIANEEAMRVSRESGLTSPRETKKQGDISVGSFVG